MLAKPINIKLRFSPEIAELTRQVSLELVAARSSIPRHCVPADADRKTGSPSATENVPLRSMVRAQLPRNRARDSFVASSPGHPGFLVVAAFVVPATTMSFHLLDRSRATFRNAGRRVNGVQFETISI